MRLSNNTKIKYLKVLDKIYRIRELSFFYMSIEAVETDMVVGDVPADEVWDIEEFKNYKIKLINNGGHAEIVDFSAWKSKNKP